MFRTAALLGCTIVAIVGIGFAPANSDETESSRSTADTSDKGGGGFGGGGFGGGGAQQANPSGLQIVRSASVTILHANDGHRFFGHGLRGGGWDRYQIPEDVRATVEISAGIAALAIEGTNLTEIAAYSPDLGRWYRCTLHAPQTGTLTPIISSEMAVFQIDGHVYAFSTRTGAWDVIRTMASPAVFADSVSIEDDEKFALFTVHTGRWAVVRVDESGAGVPDGEAGQN